MWSSMTYIQYALEVSRCSRLSVHLTLGHQLHLYSICMFIFFQYLHSCFHLARSCLFNSHRYDDKSCFRPSDWISFHGCIFIKWFSNIASIYRLLGCIITQSPDMDKESFNYMNKNKAYTEWPHRQCVGLAFRRSPISCSLAAESLASICTVQQVNLRGTALYIGGGIGNSMDLPSLTPLSIAGCGRLHLDAPHWSTSVSLLQVLYNWPHILWYSRLSTGRLPDIEYLTFLLLYLS